MATAAAPEATAAAAASAASRKLFSDLSPFIKLYADGTYERITDSPYVPPTLNDPITGVSSKDVTNISPPARIFLPEIRDGKEKIPIVLYFHGGGFITGSVFSETDLKYMNVLSSESKSLFIAVEYRLAPEQRLPAAYEDSWAALEWLCSHVIDNTHIKKDPWISNHGDFNRIYIAGDSAGGNIAHNLAMRIGSNPLPGNLKIAGVIVSQPYFWGSVEIGGEFDKDLEKQAHRVWNLCYPDAPGSIDCSMINPIASGAPNLSQLAGSKLLVAVSEKDRFTARTTAYAEEVKKSGWNGTVEFVEIKDEDHCFQIVDPEAPNSKFLIKKMAEFINSV